MKSWGAGGIAGGVLAAALAASVLVAAITAGTVVAGGAQAGNGGTIKGHIKLSGKLPGNSIIRMGMDPKCAEANRGKRVVQETVAASLDGSMANVFVRLQGTFPQTPVPKEPVVIDQRGCIYRPRVVGARVGQTLQVKNSDELLHNVHSLSAKSNTFNISEPKAGMVQQFTLKDEEVMLRIKCDVHSWMTTYVGIVTNPYFAVTNEGGTFEIPGVPAGSYTIQTWHERYGPLTQMVRVRAGAATTVDFTYTGNEKPPA
jgi:plastocyanin